MWSFLGHLFRIVCDEHNVNACWHKHWFKEILPQIKHCIKTNSSLLSQITGDVSLKSGSIADFIQKHNG